MTFEEFWSEVVRPTVANPDLKYDIINGAVDGYESYYQQLGVQFKLATEGRLSVNAGLRLGDDFVLMADRMELVAKRLNAIPLPALDQASLAIRGRLNDIVLETNKGVRSCIAINLFPSRAPPG